MCLYPRIIKNPKYTANQKNKGVIPPCSDLRQRYMAIGCGNCIECRQKKARSWRIRIMEHLKTEKGKFVTLTFAPEELEKLLKEVKENNVNEVAKLAVKRFRERWRKEEKKSVKHWLVTELGHQSTERIHLHGIIFTEKDDEYIEKKWNYGRIYVGKYCNEATANYIVKYVTKIDQDHKGYQQIILTSPGIGKNYIYTNEAKRNRYNGKNTKANYRLPTGQLIDLPIYYRNHIYTEAQRQKLWSHLLDQNIRFIRGRKIDISTKKGETDYEQILAAEQKENIRIGYGKPSIEWQAKIYKVTQTMLNKGRWKK